jgi:myo-inositol-1(or 4)-monophosphatase
MSDVQNLLQTALDAARAAGDVLRQKSAAVPQVFEKSHLDLVTDGDFAADKAIQGVIRAAFPDHVIVSEESEQAKDIAGWTPPEGFWWIIDPIDGTSNYARGMPSWSVSIAAGKGQSLLASAVYDVLRDQLFSAGKGLGATLNGQSLRVSTQDEMERTLVGADWAVGAEYRLQILRLVNVLMPQVRSLRCWGTSALALAHLAAGYLDCYLHVRLKPWDAAGGVLMVQEAGGTISDIRGEAWHIRSSSIFASNGILHDTLVGMLAPEL